jgi:hypothetical protein
VSYRALISIANGAVSFYTWEQATWWEPSIRGRPKACAGCPLRVGGEWEDGASQAIETASRSGLAALKRWGCHDAPRPCAGMRRLIAHRERACVRHDRATRGTGEGLRQEI